MTSTSSQQRLVIEKHIQLQKLYFSVKLLPMIISLIAIYLGYKLFILGVTGKASLIINSKDISGQLINAAPGLFFAIGGFICLIFSIIKGARFNIPKGTFSMDMPSDPKDTID